VKVLILVTKRLRMRRKGRLSRRKISKEEINQPPLNIMGVSVILTSLPTHIASLNFLAGFGRVTTFLRISMVFPRSYKCGLWVPKNPCCQPLNIRLMTAHQPIIIRLGEKRVKSIFLVGYVEKCTTLTFSLIWMKLCNCWKTLLFPSNNLLLFPMSLLPTNQLLMKW
jgi:hypothetical protein